MLEGAEADAGAASVKSLSLSREGSLVDEGVEVGGEEVGARSLEKSSVFER